MRAQQTSRHVGTRWLRYQTKFDIEIKAVNDVALMEHSVTVCVQAWNEVLEFTPAATSTASSAQQRIPSAVSKRTDASMVARTS